MESAEGVLREIKERRQKMSQEQDRPDDVSGRVKTLLCKYVNVESELVHYGHIPDMQKTQLEKRGSVQAKIIQMTKDLGPQGFSTFLEELERFDQKRKERHDSNIREYCLRGSTDSALGDFYDNEVAAEYRGINEDREAIKSVRGFLQQLQEGK